MLFLNNKKKYIFCCLLLIVGVCYGQDTKLDVKKNIENLLSQSFIQFADFQNPDSTYYFAQNAYQKSQNIDWDYGTGASLHRIGMSYNIRGQYDLAIESNLKALVYAEKIKKDSLTARIYYDLGSSYGKLNDNHKGIYYHNKAIPLFIKSDMLTFAGYALNNIGLCYGRLNQDSLGLIYFNKAKNIFEKIKDEFGIGVIFNNLGNYYAKQKDYKRAIENQLLGILYYEKFNNQYLMAESYIDMGRILEKVNRKSEAIKYYVKATNIAEKNKLLNLDYDANLALKELYFQENKTEKAYEYFTKADEIRKKIDEDLKQKNISSLNLKYENEKQKLFDKEREKQIKSQKQNLLFLIIGVVVLLVVIGLVIKANRQLSVQNRIINDQRSELLELNKAVEKMNIDLEDKILERTQELSLANENLIRKNREIEEALYKGQKIERKRVADELHDTLGGYLSAMRYGLMGFTNSTLTMGETQILNRVNEVLQLAYEEVRNISHNLIPVDLEKHGLAFAMTQILGDVNNNTEKRFRFYNNISNIRFNPKIEFEIYSICLELLNNAIKHSKSSNFSISLLISEMTLFLEFVEDYSNSTLSPIAIKGKGISSIKNRVNSIGGSLSINQYNYEIKVPILEKRLS